MEYHREYTLKNGKILLLRHGEAADAAAVITNFNTTHGETDYLATYPDENSFTVEQESEFLQRKRESEREIELLAVVDGELVGTAGIEALGTKYKLRHRAELGLSVLKAYWGLGIGRAMVEVCIECARRAGYTQLELEVIADNARAVALYRSVGFTEFGRNPRGMNSRTDGYQEVISMRLEL